MCLIHEIHDLSLWLECYSTHQDWWVIRLIHEIHDLCIDHTCPIHVNARVDSSMSYMTHVTHSCDMWLIHVSCDSFMCHVTHSCDITQLLFIQSHVSCLFSVMIQCHVSCDFILLFIHCHVSCDSFMSYMTRSCVTHDPFMSHMTHSCQTWLFIQSYVSCLFSVIIQCHYSVTLISVIIQSHVSCLFSLIILSHYSVSFFWSGMTCLSPLARSHEWDMYGRCISHVSHE